MNRRLLSGLALLGLLVLLAVVGAFVVDLDDARPLSVGIAQPPSWENPLGTDTAGRDLAAVLVVGPLLTVPGLLVLVVIASSWPGQMTTTLMAFVIALLSWREPTRQIRAQVLVMREAGYVRMAQISGQGSLAIIFGEMMPNLMPYLGAALVSSVSAAILASVGLEALGLGPRDEPTLGMTIYWMISEGAFLRGLWWWIVEPVAVLVTLFVGMYLVVIGLDEFANPRLRQLR